MQDVAEFLAPHPPFDALEPADLQSVAEAAEVEFHAAGTEIFHQGAGPVGHLWVVRSGAVEIVHDGRVLDLLGAGELFGMRRCCRACRPGSGGRGGGHAVLPDPGRGGGAAAGPPGRDAVRDALAAGGARRRARRAVAQPALRPVAELMRPPLAICSPETPIREAAQLMASAGATSVVIDLGDGTLGIMTDRDLRSRVVAAGADTGAPVSAVMSAPAYTVTADRLGGEVLLDMLDRCIRHFPVVSATGSVIGVVEDSDLVAVATRSSFHLRAAIARAETLAELVDAAAGVMPSVIALHDARVTATDIAAIQSVVVDALTRRLLELTIADVGVPPVPFAWVALGSLARREAVPSSDVDSALVWYSEDEDDDPALRATLRAIAERVMDGLAQCGFRADPKGAVASRPLFARSHAAWRAAARSWLENPTQEKALILVSLIVDGRPVWGVHTGPPIPDAFRDARAAPSCSTCSRGSRSPTVLPRASCAGWSSSIRVSTAGGSTSSTAGSSRSPTSLAGPASPPASRTRRLRRGCVPRPRPARWRPTTRGCSRRRST